MFCRCFGNYLLDKNLITGDQLSEILDYRKNNRVKLGLIAVENHMLKSDQVDVINRQQMKEDKRFGDIAVERGWLTESELKELLKLQQNPYLIFVQAAQELAIFSKETIDVCLQAYQKELGFSDMDMQAFKNGDMDTVVSLMLRMDEKPAKLVSLALRNVIRFVSTDLSVGLVKMVPNAEYQHLVVQQLNGDYPILLGLGCQNEELLQIAIPFGREAFTSLDEDVLDAIGEFINCTNGLYASKVSQDHVELELMPPVNVNVVSCESEQGILVLPIQINGIWMDLIVTVEPNVQLN